MKNKGSYGAREVVEMMLAYHNFTWALCESRLSPDIENKRRSKKKT